MDFDEEAAAFSRKAQKLAQKDGRFPGYGWLGMVLVDYGWGWIDPQPYLVDKLVDKP